MSETLTETFARFAEEAEFQRWRQGRTLAFQFVYASQDDGVWKFTAEEWWRFVTRAIRNHGAYSLPVSKQLQGRPKAGPSSQDSMSRSVNLLDWSAGDWENELAAI